MIMLNGNQYRLCLLDTNALSEVVRFDLSRERFLTWALDSKPALIPCFAPFSVLELRRRRDVYERFLEFFRVVPCVQLKGHEELLEEEVRSYPDPANIDPTSLGFSPLGGEGMDLQLVYRTAEADTSFLADERRWNDAQEEIVDGMTSLVRNFPPAGQTYTRSEMRTFLEIAAFSQLAMRQSDFARAVVERGDAVDIDAFPSLKATTYTVWHKFYADRTRKPSRSDAFDVVISAATPYVDAVVTEKHQAEALRKMRRLDVFIDHLDVRTVTDLLAPH